MEIRYNPHKEVHYPESTGIPKQSIGISGSEGRVVSSSPQPKLRKIIKLKGKIKGENIFHFIFLFQTFKIIKRLKTIIALKQCLASRRTKLTHHLRIF